MAEVTKDVACTPVAAVTVPFISEASGVTTEFVPIPGILNAGAVVESAVTTTVLGDDTTMTDTVAEGAAVVVVVVVL